MIPINSNSVEWCKIRMKKQYHHKTNDDETATNVEKGLFSLIFRRFATKFFLEALAEITRGTETCVLRYLGNSLVAFQQHVCGTVQADTTDEGNWRLLHQGRQPLVEARALHAEVCSQALHVIGGIGDMLLNQLCSTSHKLFLLLCRFRLCRCRSRGYRLIEHHKSFCLFVLVYLLHKVLNAQQQHVLTLLLLQTALIKTEDNSNCSNSHKEIQQIGSRGLPPWRSDVKQDFPVVVVPHLQGLAVQVDGGEYGLYFDVYGLRVENTRHWRSVE